MSEERMSAWFDKSIVEKVVFNLLSNAMKFTPNNGKVVFSLSRCTFAELPSEQQASSIGNFHKFQNENLA